MEAGRWGSHRKGRVFRSQTPLISQPGGPKDLTRDGASNTPSGRTAQEERGYQNPVPCSALPPHKLLDPERGWRPQCRQAQPASDTLQ